MRRFPLLLLLAATSAGARTPAPAPTDAVPDREVLRLLSAQYDARARLQGGWSSRAEPATRHAVCSDSGARRGDRLLAVCTTTDEATRVDLLVVEPAATQRGRARISARFRGIERSPGDAGDIHLMAIAPDRVAFVLGETQRRDGTTHARESLYAERDDGLRRLLTVGTRVDTTGRCAPGPDRAGRRCTQRSVALRCTLRADTSRVVAGAWPLELQVSGVRHGEAVNRIVPIPHDAYGYRISARVLETQGCDGAD
jgi:hypothetical protein